MRVETGLGDRPWDDVVRQARLAEEMGFDGIGAPELKRDPFLTVAVVARETRTIRLETSVAIAFPRSPMVVAYESFNLQELTGGEQPELSEAAKKIPAHLLERSRAARAKAQGG